MNTTVTLDKAGRAVIPKPVRDALRLAPGDTLELVSEGESLTLSPVRSGSPLRKERGVWVFRVGQKLAAADTEKVLRDIRGERGPCDTRSDRHAAAQACCGAGMLRRRHAAAHTVLSRCTPR